MPFVRFPVAFSTPKLRRMMASPLKQLALTLGALLVCRAPASALPIFAHEYGMSCQKCHSVIPRLNEFGEAFLENGYHLPLLAKHRRHNVIPAPPTAAPILKTSELQAVDAFVQPAAVQPAPAPASPPSSQTNSPALAQLYPYPAAAQSDYLKPGPAFPISVKANFQYTDAPEATYPRAIFDELELLTAGIIGPRLNYFGEQYIIDGGAHGLLREAWVRDQVNPIKSRIPLAIVAGQFTLPLPIDVESFRESATHYAVWDQAVGDNPFTFFDPKIGFMATAGSRLRGTSITTVLDKGHDRQSGIATIGLDDMLYVQHVAGPIAFSAYRYAGRRPDGAFTDHFERTGYAAVYTKKRWESDTILQTGWDSSADGTGVGASSSGGFSQLRYMFTDRVFGLVRLDGTSDSNAGLVRTSTYLAGYRPSSNARITVENTLSHAPQTHNDFVVQYTVAY